MAAQEPALGSSLTEGPVGGGGQRGEEFGGKPKKQKADGGEGGMMRGGCRALCRRIRTSDVTLSEMKSIGGF